MTEHVAEKEETLNNHVHCSVMTFQCHKYNCNIKYIKLMSTLSRATSNQKTTNYVQEIILQNCNLSCHRTSWHMSDPTWQ